MSQTTQSRHEAGSKAALRTQAPAMRVLHKEKDMLFGEDRPFLSCHASTVLALPGGGQMVAYFGGFREGYGDVAIWLSVKQDGIWSRPRKVADEEGVVHWNPVLHRQEDGTILLFYKVGKPIPQWYTKLIRSEDGGRTWSEPEELVPGDRGGRGPVKNKLIVLRDGTWIAPASLEGEVWDSFADRSEDQGRTWTASTLVPTSHAGKPGVYCRGAAGGPQPDPQWRSAELEQVRGKGLIQPTCWESAPGHVHMLMRSTSGFIYRSDSADGGRSWSPAAATRLPNNNCGIDLAQLENGALILAYNPVGMYKGPRSPLLLSISYDNGYTWEELEILEYHAGEYSYPAVVADGNRIYVSYTWNRERIACWMLELEERS